MLHFLFILLASLAGGSLAGYPDDTFGNDLGNSGNSYGYGYSGGFSGAGGPPPNFPFSSGLDFSNFFDTLNRYQQDLFRNGGGLHSYSHASSSPNSKADAFSSITFTNVKKGIQAQATNAQNIHTRTSFPGGGGDASSSSYGGGYGGSFGNGGSYGSSFSSGYPGAGTFQFIPGDGVKGTYSPDAQGASAFGSIGPDGIRQSASVYPENANVPNVNVRFGASDQPNGFKSVFTSSSSFTQDVDGKPKTVQKSVTTVNDNGKITTYTAKNP